MWNVWLFLEHDTNYETQYIYTINVVHVVDKRKTSYAQQMGSWARRWEQPMFHRWDIQPWGPQRPWHQLCSCIHLSRCRTPSLQMPPPGRILLGGRGWRRLEGGVGWSRPRVGTPEGRAGGWLGNGLIKLNFLQEIVTYADVSWWLHKGSKN